MNTTQIPKPFTIDEIIKLCENSREKMLKNFSNFRKVGFILTLISVAIYLFIYIQITNHNQLFHLLAIISLFFGIYFLIMPSVLLLFTNIEQQYIFDYEEASKEIIYNCEAYIRMPQMEKLKPYVEEVKKQGRKLNNQECNFIITQWRLVISDYEE